MPSIADSEGAARSLGPLLPLVDPSCVPASLTFCKQRRHVPMQASSVANPQTYLLFPCIIGLSSALRAKVALVCR